MTTINVRGALLAAFLIASGAPLLVFWLWPHRTAAEQEIEAVRERHLLLARNVAGAVADYADDLESVFLAFAPLIARNEPVDFARDLFRDLRFRNVCVRDPRTGRVISSFLAEAAPCPDTVRPDRLEMLRDLAAGGGARLSSVKVPSDGSPPRLFIAYDAGDRLVIGAIETTYFTEIAGKIGFGRQGHAIIYDADGLIVAHPRTDWVAEAKAMADLPVVARAMAGESGVMRFMSPAFGVEMIAGYAPVEGPGWSVVVAQPVAELEARADSIMTSALVVLFAGLALSAAFALAFSHHVARSVGRVSAAALRMAGGENGVRIAERDLSHALAEFAALGRSFNQMAARVEHAQQRAAALARFDELTGLQNRGAFFETAAAELASAAAQGREVALFFIDIDRFKLINDGHGHAVGDEVLRRVALRLRRSVGGRDLVARHSGDEFVVLHRKRAAGSCALLGARIASALSEPIRVGDDRFVVTASVGVATFPRDGATLDALILRADQAMYGAKWQGGNAVRRFDAALRRRLDEDVALTRRLQEALDTGDIDIAFQPVMRAADGALAGFEALARWPGGEGPPPDRFVAVAEATGLIAALGQQVRRKAFQFAAAIRAEGAPLPVSVNVSQLELARLGLAEEIESQLASLGLPPDSVTLEITEGAFRESGAPELDCLHALRRLGVGLALDDFGKGFSSHRRLRAYPVDRLKIDLAFVGDVVTDPQARAVAKSLVKLGISLGLRVTVENVETEEQQQLMVRLGVHEIQGYWHHPPMTAEQAFALARASRDARALARAV